MLRQTVRRRASPLYFPYFSPSYCDVSQARSYFASTITTETNTVHLALLRIAFKLFYIVDWYVAAFIVALVLSGKEMFHVTLAIVNVSSQYRH
jgi:hypothetical protein